MREKTYLRVDVVLLKEPAPCVDGRSVVGERRELDEGVADDNEVGDQQALRPQLEVVDGRILSSDGFVRLRHRLCINLPSNSCQQRLQQACTHLPFLPGAKRICW
jgi:hypothetical protein